MIEHTLTDTEFSRFQRLLYQLTGIALTDAKKMLLVGRLSKRLKALQLRDFAAYYDYVIKNPDELQLMVELITTNETYFFREEKHFHFLATQIVPAHPPEQSFDVWSAACSTGEEVYTICMVLADTLGIDGKWTVTGSDINSRVLAMARSGHYPMEKARGLPQAYLRKYCLKGIGKQEGTFLVLPELRRHTRFVQANLNQPLPAELGKFHVIFLRNVLIYFDNDSKRRVVDRLVDHLHPHGWFIIGHAETLNGLTERLRPVQPSIYRLP